MIQVLDHGFVILRNIAGPNGQATERDAPNAARMSFDAEGTRTEEEDLKLARYLMRNKHTTPFEMVELWIEMKLPIFVARQFVRHRTVSINEVSGRYVTLPREWYIPDVVGGKARSVKQGQEDNLDPEVQAWFKHELDSVCELSYGRYLSAIKVGIAPEHARLLLHLNHYTHWLWKQDLHNIMHFLSLRDHSHAQFEAQQYARAIDQLIREKLPKTMELYDQFRRLPE